MTTSNDNDLPGNRAIGEAADDRVEHPVGYFASRRNAHRQRN